MLRYKGWLLKVWRYPELFAVFLKVAGAALISL